MLKEAVFHQIKSEYAYIIGDRTLVLRLRSKKNDLIKVLLHIEDRFEPRNPITTSSLPMAKRYTDQLFDYYEIEIKLEKEDVSYYFELESETESIYYLDIGFCQEVPIDHNTYFCLPYVLESDYVSVPEWAKGAVFYQIFPDRFAKGEAKRNQNIHFADWNEAPKGQFQFFGGNLEGLIEKIPYFKKLGVDCLYFTPIFKSDTNHRYSTIDYYEIDPILGDKDLFKKFVKELHKAGVKIVLDAVFNHCGDKFFAFLDVCENGKNSQYANWFCLYENVVDLKKVNYKTWAGVKNMPKLNLKNPQTKDYFLDVARFWIEEFDIDGWRLDVANEIDHDFWRAFRKIVKSVKRDALIIGEVWHDARKWLEGDQFDGVMNYLFYHIVNDFFAFKKIKVSELDARIQGLLAKYKGPISQVMWNLIDSHDTSRFLYKANENQQRMKLAVAYQILSLGCPMIYYGDEWGVSGGDDPLNRKTVPWGREETLITYYQELIALRKNEQAIRYGSYESVLIDDLKQLYGFKRAYKGEIVVVLMNLSSEQQEVYYKPVQQDKILLEPYNVQIFVQKKSELNQFNVFRF
jgi:glycosidase